MMPSDCRKCEQHFFTDPVLQVEGAFGYVDTKCDTDTIVASFMHYINNRLGEFHKNHG